MTYIQLIFDNIIIVLKNTVSIIIVYVSISYFIFHCTIAIGLTYQLNLDINALLRNLEELKELLSSKSMYFMHLQFWIMLVIHMASHIASLYPNLDMLNRNLLMLSPRIFYLVLQLHKYCSNHFESC